MATAIKIANVVTGGAGNSIGGAQRGGAPSPPPAGFRFRVDTRNSGATRSTDYKLPTRSAGVYNFTVDWGDGSTDTITSYNQAEVTHSYSTGGIYTIDITGDFTGIDLFRSGDPLKVLEILNWGGTNLTINNIFALRGATNMTCSATDSPTLTGDISGCFYQSNAITSGLANWDFSNVTSAQWLLLTVPNWNEDISSWDVTSCTNFGSAFTGTSMSQANYDALLIAWAAQSVQSNVAFATSAQYTGGRSSAAATARNTLVNTYSWTITDGGPN